MIKSLFNPGNYTKRIDTVLLLLRLAGGIFMLTHGMGKFTSLFSGEPIQFPDPIGVGASASLALTVFSEVLCATLLIVGFATRAAAIPLLITMLVAVFVIHGADGWGKQELPLLYGVVYLAIAVAGAGRLSIDNWLFAKLGSR
jgi:putative oxidoreductase